MEQNKSIHNFSKENIKEFIHIWNKASISLIDIRHKLISPEDVVSEYIAPASIFVFANTKNAQVTLDGVVYKIERFGIFHGGKGCKISICPKDWVEYYMIIYKAGEPAFSKREYAKLLKSVNPFLQQYGFMPGESIFFTEQVRLMYQYWCEGMLVNQLGVKAIFYQLIHDIYTEVGKNCVCMFEPDMAVTAMQYMQENYNRLINIQEISSTLGISYSHFHRIFKTKAGKSPQEYLIQIRLINAMKFLEKKEHSISEVANYCGFSDERNFRRIFIKNIGMTPSVYREKIPAKMRENTLGNVIYFPYNKNHEVSDNELENEGEKVFMLNRIKNKTIIAVALCLLLVSACSTTPDTRSAKSETIQTEGLQDQQTNEVESIEKETRTVTTVMGDVEVPKDPQKIFVSDYVGDLLAFGVTPSYAYTIYENAPYEALIQDVTQVEDIEVEHLMSLEPDLIIVSYESNYEEYSKIAPIYIPYTTSVEERIKLLGQVLGKEGEADQLMTDFYQKVEDTKEELTKAGIMDQTITVLSIEGDTLYVYADQFGRGGEILYSYLGMKAPKPIQEDMIGNAEKQWKELSLEALPEYCGDYIVLTKGSELDTDLERQPVWMKLDAVKNNRVFKKTIGFTLYKDYFSLNAMLDDFRKDLLTTN